MMAYFCDYVVMMASAKVKALIMEVIVTTSMAMPKPQQFSKHCHEFKTSTDPRIKEEIQKEKV